ncbi:hypothetical protein [Endozoicomonas sp.]|uniref:hypothetical protein n=1 Tax=Endozoicomonas sp. TaxID=1892382 RepID=UPI00383AD27A
MASFIDAAQAQALSTVYPDELPGNRCHSTLFMNRETEKISPVSLVVNPGSKDNQVPETAILIRTTELIKPPASDNLNKPKPAPFYKGLQNIYKIAEFQGIDPNSTEIKWKLNNLNLFDKLLAPWNKNEVEAFIKGIDTSPAKSTSADVAENRQNEHLPITSHAIKVALSAMINGGEGNIGSQNKYNYDATGHQLTKQDIDKVLSLIKTASWQTEFSDECRGITNASADALFLPTDKFITKDLTDTSNSASDQKSSSTLIPPNTPVFILAQLNIIPGLNPEEDSWLAIWRPEFGLKFVKSRNVGLIDHKDIEQYSQIQSRDNPSTLKMPLTDRVKESHTFNRLAMGTPLPIGNGSAIMAKCTFEERTVTLPTYQLKLYLSKLEKIHLETVDNKGDKDALNRQVQQVPLPLNHKNFFNQLSNNILKYPSELVTPAENENRCFAWGEGTIGPDGERGQDISTFILKTIRPFGTWLPRHSQDQINEGNVIEGSQTDGKSLDDNYQALLKHGKPGIFVSWGRGNNMASLGSVSVDQLGDLNKDAARDALNSGMKENDKIPLLALSPIALTTKDEDGTIQWHHTGRTAVHPVFKEGENSTFIRKGRELKFFNYFTEVTEKSVNQPAPEISNP